MYWMKLFSLEFNSCVVLSEVQGYIQRTMSHIHHRMQWDQQRRWWCDTFKQSAGHLGDCRHCQWLFPFDWGHWRPRIQYIIEVFHTTKTSYRIKYFWLNNSLLWFKILGWEEKHWRVITSLLKTERNTNIV